MFLAHNETLNIWTHFFGSLFTVAAISLIMVQAIQQNSIASHVKYLVSHPQRQVVSQLQALVDSHSVCAVTNNQKIDGGVEDEGGEIYSYISVLSGGAVDEMEFRDKHDRVMELVGLHRRTDSEETRSERPEMLESGGAEKIEQEALSQLSQDKNSGVGAVGVLKKALFEIVDCS